MQRAAVLALLTCSIAASSSEVSISHPQPPQGSDARFLDTRQRVPVLLATGPREDPLALSTAQGDGFCLVFLGSGNTLQMRWELRNLRQFVRIVTHDKRAPTRCANLAGAAMVKGPRGAPPVPILLAAGLILLLSLPHACSEAARKVFKAPCCSFMVSGDGFCWRRGASAPFPLAA
jgi:hypothetical protein